MTIAQHQCRTTEIAVRLLISAAVLLGITAGCESTNPEPARPEPLPLMVENADGSITLNSPLPVNLIGHLQRTLVEADFDLMYDQLISTQTKRRYQERGKDPRECLQWFQSNRADIMSTLGRMSNGVNSPSVIHQQSGNVLTIRVHGQAAQTLKYRTLETVRERGSFRLLMISR